MSVGGRTPRSGPGRPLIAAIDIGSSSVRAGLFRDDGTTQPRTFVQVAYQPDVDGRGAVSVEFPRVLDVLGQTLDGFVAKAGSRLDGVAAVGIS
jgi:sugar (pentulose or hexulose) kinase